MFVPLGIGAGAAVAARNAGSAVYSVAPAPAWVEPVAPALASPPPPEDVKGGRYFLLDDTQVNVRPRGHETYRRLVTRALTAAGVRQTGQINIDVDPTFQTLVLHHVRIIRDGHSVEQLGQARITSVPIETELESRIYNGTYTVNVLLEDLRIGDVVDYAYTLRSLGQLWSDHFSMRVFFGWSEPLRLERLRIIYPPQRHLRYQAFGDQVTPHEAVRHGQGELRFEWHDLPAVVDDASRPTWYSPWPWLEVSDWVDWNDVARNGASLYARSLDGHESLDGVITSIRDTGRTVEAQAQRALQFVQEQIRYTSIAIGAGSQTPSSPQIVLKRRFGDCKDKSLLLVSLLRGLGIHASPALVSSTRGHILPDRLPSISLFDHVITRVSLPSGTFWLDPTVPKQLLPIALLDPPDFEFALPLSPSTAGLESIPRPATGVLRREVSVRIDANKGLTAPATLDVVTRYLGPSVDSTRADLEAVPPAERQKNYLNYYANYYPGIQSVAPPEIQESAAHDAIVVTERYRLGSVFTKESDGLYHFSITPDEILPYSQKLDAAVRSSPLSIPFPVSVVQSFLVTLPEHWQAKGEIVSVDNPAFRYGSDLRIEKNQLRVRYSYVALKDHVPVAELAKYIADRARVNDDLGYQLTKGTTAKGLADYAIAPLPLVVLLIALAGGSFLAIRIHRFDPPANSQSLERGAPTGIRGWLLLPALNALALPLVVTWLLGAFSLYVRSDVWIGIVSVVGPDARSWIRLALLGCLGATGALFPITVAAALLFFKKRTSAPVVFIAILFGTLVLAGIVDGGLIYTGLDDTTPPQKFWAQTARDTLTTLLWCAYLLKSKRVRATFVKRRRVVAGEADASLRAAIQPNQQHAPP